MVVGYGDSRRVWVVCKVVGCVMLGEEGSCQEMLAVGWSE